MTREASRVHAIARTVSTVVAGGVLATLLVACGGPGAGGPAAVPQDTPSPTPARPAPTAAVDVPVASATLEPPVAAVAPVQLQMPDFGVDMPVIDVGIDPAGAMELPPDPAVAGWYRYGPDAASGRGHIVIAAHVDAPAYGIGPLSRLRDVGAGTAVRLRAADGTERDYRVESVTMYDKAVLPTEELFDRDGKPALVLITCGGPFDSSTGHYRDNVVAIAREA